MMKPSDKITEPAIVTVRHPNLLLKAVTIGPKMFKNTTGYHYCAKHDRHIHQQT